MKKKNNELAVQEEKSLTEGMGREQIELIKNTVARGATDDELKLFLYTANRTGLDPLTKQIHFIKRRVWSKATNSYNEVGTIQTGIDGYRVVASRNGLAGIEDAIFDSEDGLHPNKSSVTVFRLVGGNRVPFTASARWNEYAQTDKQGNSIAMWAKMPYLMLGKVAEALALRKAFPNDLSGVYTNEEMSQADNQDIKTFEPYKVERIVPAEDDEQGGHVETVIDVTPVRAYPKMDETNDASALKSPKEQIKELLLRFKKNPSTQQEARFDIKAITNVFWTPGKNDDAIITNLQNRLDAGDALKAFDEIVEQN